MAEIPDLLSLLAEVSIAVGTTLLALIAVCTVSATVNAVVYRAFWPPFAIGCVQVTLGTVVFFRILLLR